jgi:poly-gamma-glutamate synthesis protein (capsule biosynthesis protein)
MHIFFSSGSAEIRWYNRLMKTKRRLKPWVRILLLVLACACGFLLIRAFLPKEEKTPEEPVQTAETTPEPTPEPTPTPEPQPTVKTLSLYMLGDALVQQPNSWDAERADGSYDWAPQMDGIADPAKNYDLAFYNQECILGGDHLGITPFPHFNCPQSYGDYMVSKGFNLISVANNHSLDKGEEACENSHAFWAAKEGVVTSGMNMSQEERSAIPIYEKNGITYAFTAWTYDMNGWQPPAGREYMVNKYRGHEEELLNWVRSAKEQADFVIVSMHWGTEYTHNPDEEQMRLAQQLSDAGADVIIGNHAHHSQPIQWLNDRTICFYALGNMLSAQTWQGFSSFEELNTGIAASLVMEKVEYPDGTVTKQVRDVKADLIFTWHTGDYEHMYSAFYKDLTDEQLPDHDYWYEWHIDNVVHAMSGSIEIGL